MITELRGEVITGKQTATQNSSETPAALITGMNGHYIRNFNGAYFYLLQNITLKHQVVVKYDWYDPNSNVYGMEILPEISVPQISNILLWDLDIISIYMLI